MLMHYHALYFFLSFFPKPCLLLCSSFLFFLYLVSCLWHQRNLFLQRTWSHVVVLLHLLLPPSLILCGSVMRRPNRTPMRTSLIGQFIWKCHVSLSDFLDTPLPSVFSSQGWASLCEIPKRCPSVFIQEFYFNMHAIDTSVLRFTMLFWGTRIVVTPEFISKVLCVPRVDHPDYPRHIRLRYISWDKMATLFYEKAMVWGETLNFSIIEFAKGSWILYMVMTFVLTPRSHYNTITKPCACFLLFLMEDPSIDFPSHRIESMIDIYWDTITHDKLIFPLAITCILSHVHVTFPLSTPFYAMGAINKESIRRSDA